MSEEGKVIAEALPKRILEQSRMPKGAGVQMPLMTDAESIAAMAADQVVRGTVGKVT